jgi:hypothetical protein
LLSDALAECARPRACSPRTVSKWTKVVRVDHPRKDECEHRSDRRPKVGSQPVRPRHCYPTPWPSVRGHGHAAPAPFLNGQKSVSSTPCQYVCEHRFDRRPKVGNQPASYSLRSPTLSQTVRGHGHAAPSSSARYGSLPILTSSMLTVDYQRRSSTPTHESMRKRQRTVGNRLVACATVPRDFLEQCGLAETRTWWRACGPILHNKAQCVHHLQLITSCFLELLQDPIEIGRSSQAMKYAGKYRLLQ